MNLYVCCVIVSCRLNSDVVSIKSRAANNLDRKKKEREREIYNI